MENRKRQQAATNSRGNRDLAIWINRQVLRLSRHWFAALNIVLLIFVGLPWLAPIFMHWGWDRAGELIYLIYTTQCHQLPQRSFFLFGEQFMYSLPQIQAAWQDTNNPLILRQFIGDETMGWKVAWSDRMVYMYTCILFFGAIYQLGRRWIRPLPWWGLVLLLLPMFIDGSSHIIGELMGGMTSSFRDENLWLVNLTNNAFAPDFYAGDAFGSFNSWMRLITGLLFGLGVTWFLYPRMQESFGDTAAQIEAKFERAGVK
jgi:uncharacterized membrane protein